MTSQIEVLGRCEQDPKSLQLEIGATGTVEGSLPDGRSLYVEKAAVAEILERSAGAIAISFVVESVHVHTAAGPYSRALFPKGTDCVFRWILTGTAWLDDWLNHSRPESSFKLAESHELQIEGQEVAHPIQASRLGHAARSLYTVPVLTFKVDASGKTLDDIKSSTPQGLVDNLLTALSCLSRSRIEWTHRTLSVVHPDDEQQAESVFRLATPNVLRSFTYPGIYPPSVPPRVIEFACTRLREFGESLRSAIQFYVASFGLAEEQSFVALTTSLEALKQTHIDGQPVQGILSDDDFGGLRSRVEESVTQYLTESGGSSALDSICEKLNELNRPAYATVVRDMCAKLNVNLQEIYPNELTFISVRNNMIHRGTVPSPDHLRTETMLIRKLVEAVLHRMLTPAKS